MVRWSRPSIKAMKLWLLFAFRAKLNFFGVAVKMVCLQFHLKSTSADEIANFCGSSNCIASVQPSNNGVLLWTRKTAWIESVGLTKVLESDQEFTNHPILVRTHRTLARLWMTPTVAYSLTHFEFHQRATVIPLCESLFLANNQLWLWKMIWCFRILSMAVRMDQHNQWRAFEAAIHIPLHRDICT